MTCGKAEDGGGRNPAGPETALPCHGKAGHHPQHHPLPGASHIHEKEKASSIRVGQSGSGSHRRAEARGSPLTQAGSCREQGALSRLQACLQPASTGRYTSQT